MGEGEDDTGGLDRKDGLPQAARLNAEDRSRAHGRTCPRHQVQDAHGQNSDTQQCSPAHVHALVDRQHGGNDNTERRRAAAVKMSYQRDDAGHDADTDDIVSDERHELADDDIKHARICHDAEVQNREHEQCRGRSCAAESGLDHVREIVEGDASGKNQNQSENSGPYDERDGRLRLALEERDDDSDYGQQTKNANYCFAHYYFSSRLIETIVWVTTGYI